jgi:hypothetical protein
MGLAIRQPTRGAATAGRAPSTRRLTREIAVVLAIKLAFLVVIKVAFFGDPVAPQVDPAAVGAAFLGQGVPGGQTSSDNADR